MRGEISTLKDKVNAITFQLTKRISFIEEYVSTLSESVHSILSLSPIASTVPPHEIIEKQSPSLLPISTSIPHITVPKRMKTNSSQSINSRHS
eukprot:371452_1